MQKSLESIVPRGCLAMKVESDFIDETVDRINRYRGEKNNKQ